MVLSLVIIPGCRVEDADSRRNESSIYTRNREEVVETEILPADGPTESDFPELHNLMQVTEDIFSGAEPKSETAFHQLAELGVKVIVSVDGARPKVDLARKYGMRYVHIPIGYDGFDVSAVSMFAKAADELDETIYVHCHHGKHRGPAGAAAICAAKNLVDGQQALKILEQGGTSKKYSGLWHDVENFERPAANVELPNLVSVTEVGSLAAAMAQIDRSSDNLKLCRAADWQTPTLHPDISLAQEALLLKEGFHELLRHTEETDEYDRRFLNWMQESEQLVDELQEAIKKVDILQIESTFNAVQTNCNECHSVYRN